MSKYLVDRILAGILFVFLIPVIIGITVLLFLLQKKVFFTQIRIGKNNKPFFLRKFCTLHDNNPSNTTALGRILRRTGLDELPQLLNVMNGDMSLIGPRPLPFNYLKYFRDDELKRHLVRPGITGLAQVNGRNDLTWDHKFKWDKFYVDKVCFLLDLKISVRTLKGFFGKDTIMPSLAECRSNDESI